MVAARWHFLNPKPQALNTPPLTIANACPYSSLVPDYDCAILQPKTYSMFCLGDPKLRFLYTILSAESFADSGA